MKDKPLILIVDDKIQNVELLELYLAPQGYGIITAENGDEALEKLSSLPVDLILMDIVMPGIDGLEVTRRIRRDNTLRLLPIILITALHETEDRVKGIEAGCDDFISKPVDKLELLAKVKSLLKIKSLHDEVKAAGEYAESIINTVREPLIVLDQDLRVVTVSRSFYDVFKVKPEETVGKLIYDLGNKQWDIPKLRELLETILPQKTSFHGFEVEHDFSTIGRRIMLLNARQIQRQMNKELIILLTIEDITERKLLQSAMVESEERFRRVFETSEDGLLLVHKAEGDILNSNKSAQKLFCYSQDEFSKMKFWHMGIVKDAEDFQAMMVNVERDGVLHYDDSTVITKEGNSIHADVIITDRAKVMQCNIRNITERRKAAEVLVETAVEREKLIKSLQHAMDNIKTLQGLIPICANCKKIRDDKGFWNQVEGYIMKHSDATFTHGVCPECAKKLYGDHYEHAIEQLNKKNI